MSQSNASSKVRCPFYLYHRLRERELHCEGHAEGCTLVSQFRTVAELKSWMENRCQADDEACAIYRMVMAEKYGGQAR